MVRVLIGAALIAIGIVVLGDRAEYWDGGDVLSNWWPLAIVAIGLAQLTGRPRPWLGAGIVIAIGLGLLVVQLDLLPLDVWQLLWPSLLIALGLWLVVSHLRRGRVSADGDQSVDMFVIFGDSRSVNRSPSFKGGSLTAIFGEARLDLRQATPDRSGAHIDMTAIFGDAEVLVPRGWNVRVSALPILGDVEDRTEHAGTLPEGAPRLVVNGLALFGDVEIKHQD